ncbi:hypothetical protein LCGC14_2703430 [marine sediment metagenome]|uniref:PD-(D/E)XK endonuclease-like domain-containing protein n=1 Tax=marine sediment metagenome TaxID=412755 RepID=A0A0F8ZF12_9ZZZZ
MGELIQKYAWSESRVKTLRECMKKYYYTYCLSWSGWKSSAPQERRRAYMLKNLTNLPMFVGSVTHDTIEMVIKTGRKTGKWMELKDAQKRAVQALRVGWLDSVNKKWQGSPKHHTNLAEHFYDEEIPEEKLKGYKNKVLVCLKSFYDCPLFSIMKNLSKEAWLTIEDFATFKLKTGEEVAVKIDCGFRHENKIFLLDFKTGAVNDSVIDQLITYGMYAIKQGWTTNPEDIIIIPVYLFAYPELGDKAMPHLSISMDQLKRQAKTIQKEFPMLKEAHEKQDDVEFFQHTHSERTCGRCHFRDMCSGAVTDVQEGETPF